MILIITSFYTVFALLSLGGVYVLARSFHRFFEEGLVPGEATGYLPLLFIASISIVDLVTIAAAIPIVWRIRKRGSIRRRRAWSYPVVLSVVAVSGILFSWFTGDVIWFDRGYMHPVPISLSILAFLTWATLNVPGSLLIDASLPVRRAMRFNAMIPVGFAFMFALTGLMHRYEYGPFQLTFIAFEYLSIMGCVLMALICLIRVSSALEGRFEGDALTARRGNISGTTP